MKQSHLFYAAAVVVLAGCADDPIRPEARTAPQFAQANDVAGRYIIELNGNGPADLAGAVSALGGTVVFSSVDAGVATVSGLDDAGAAALAKVSGVGAIYADEPIELAPQAVDVDLAVVDAAGVNSPAAPATAVVYARQWNMRVVNAPAAWAAGKLGSPDVTVAILDTGIDYDSHDSNGLVDLSRSASFVPSDDAFMNTYLPTRHKIEDLNGHGTNVASQVSSNAVFFAGVNSKTKLIGVKVLGANGSGSLSGIVAGLIHAADQGADVANMSLGVKFGVDKRGNGQYVGAVNKVMNYAHRKGMVVVVSAGNNAQNMDNQGLIFRAYCEAPHVVCVSATGPTASPATHVGPWTNQDALAPYSNFGRQAITVAAPGGNAPGGFVWSVCARKRLFGFTALGAPVFSCTPPTVNNTFTVGYAGTSQAAPHVAGLVAKLVEVHGANNPAQVKQALIKSGVDDLGTPGKDPIYGEGRINVAKALGL